MINSLTNNYIKSASQLLLKKYRTLNKKFLAQGIRIVTDAFLINPNLVEHIFITTNCEREVDEFILKNSPRFNEIYLSFKEKLIYVNENVINKLSLSKSAQGIIAVINMTKETAPTDYCLYLNKIRDPGNLGTIIRTANACGYSLILDNCVDIYSPKVVQSSMSSILSVNFSFGSIETLIDLNKSGYKIICANLDGKNIFSAKYNKPICVVIGNEANGIDPLILSEFNDGITIPMLKGESLNAGVSAGIIMYQLKYNS